MTLEEERRLRVLEDRELRRIERVGKDWIDFSSGYGPMEDSCEHSKEFLVSVMFKEVLE
jgi:hypothetical protein